MISDPRPASGVQAEGADAESDKTPSSAGEFEHMADEPIVERQTPKETGGPKGLEPTRFGDWEKDGRCTDF